MCFSAQASFGASAALAGIGVLSVRSAPSRAFVPLAAIPLVFAAQQASEGALWLALDRAPFGRSDTSIARVFLFFALFVWPAYLPFALLAIERVAARRRVLAAAAVVGGALGAYLMACATLRASDACIAFANLYYWVQIDAPLKHAAPFVYVACIVVPLVASSQRGTSLLALAALASFAIVGSLYRAGFVSVWCFAAAIMSGIVALIVRAARAPRGTRLRRRLLPPPTPRSPGPRERPTRARGAA